MFTVKGNEGKPRFFSIKGKLMFFYGIVYLFFALSFSLTNYFSTRVTLSSTLDRQMDHSLQGIITVVQTSINTAVNNILRNRVVDLVSEVSRIPISLLEEVDLNGNDGYVSENYIMDLNGILITDKGGLIAGQSIWGERDDKGLFYIQNLISRGYAIPDRSLDNISHQVGGKIYLSVFSILKERGWIIVSSVDRSLMKSYVEVDDFRDDIVSLVFGNNGSVEIFDKAGIQIIHSAKQFEGNVRDTETHNIMVEKESGTLERRERLADVSSLQYVTTSSSGGPDEMIDKIYKFSAIPDMDWYIAVGVDEAEVYAPLYKIRDQSLVLTSLFFLALAAMSLLATEKVIMKNLRLLTKGISSFKQKKFHNRVDVHSHDELESLCDSFNHMAERIEDYSIHMENIVAERTNDLLQSEKMAALGGLVAGIAHEINTPIGISVTASTHLMNEAEELKKKYEKNDISRQDLNQFLQVVDDATNIIYTSVSNAGALISRFKKIAVDQSVEEPRFFLFREYLEDILLSLKPQLKKYNLELSINCQADLELYSDPGYFYQILYNLIFNSLIHGYEEGDKGNLSFDVSIDEEDFTIIYSDDGSGIPEKALPHIFEPFYTSRRGKGGTGLGLHIIYNLVTQTLGGTIKCESQRGTSFIIAIPLLKLKKGDG